MATAVHSFSSASREPAETWKPLSAIRDRIGVVLVGLLIFSIVLAIAGFVASFDARQKMSAFESDSRTAVGTTAKKYTRSLDRVYWSKAFNPDGKDRMYVVDICFTMQDKSYHCGAVEVPGGTYDGLRIGSPLQVTYVSGHPDWFYVGDNAPVDPDADVFTRLFQYCTLSALLLVIMLAAMVFWQRGDGAGRQRRSGAEANDVALRFRQRHGFGRPRVVPRT